MNNSLVILGRYPSVKGQVKTRLAKDIGAVKAVELYREWIEKIFKESLKLKNTDIYFCYASIEDKQNIQEWLQTKTNGKILPLDPISENIEKNMLNVFTNLFRTGSKKIVTAASDLPDLKVEDITQAFDVLGEYQVVLSPDQGGGISLFGVTKMYQDLFTYQYKNKGNIFKEEIDRLKELNLKYCVRPLLKDVDTENDLSDTSPSS